MAKQIKVIQCPKCGSTQKVEIKPDYYRCENCNTEYFLDNDDININHHYNNNITSNKPILTPNSGKSKNMAGLIVMFLLTLFFVTKWAITSNKPKYPTKDPTATDEAKSFSWWHEVDLTFTGVNQKPTLVIVGDRDYNGTNRESKKGVYVSFYDLLSGKELNSQRLTSIDGVSGNEFKIKNFLNGKMYIIANKTKVFSVNKSSYTVEDVTKTEFQSQPDLVSGIANIDFLYDYYGDAFNLTTNDGKNLFYFPVINKIYTEAQLSKAASSFETLLPGAQNKTAFTFSSKSIDYSDEKVQLVKYVYKDNNEGPRCSASFEWRKDYNTYGTKSRRFIDKDHYRIISFTDFTPGRMYFQPKVLCWNDKYLLISYQVTAAEKAPTSIQCLNTETGTIVFTTSFTEMLYLTENGCFPYPDGFIIKSNISTIAIDMDGKILKTFKTN